MLELMKGIQSIMEAHKAIKPGEKVLVIADNEGKSIWVAQHIMDVAGLMGAEAVLIIMNEVKIAGTEPPIAVAAAMKSVDAIFQVYERGGLTHSNARKEATAAGARWYILTDIPVEDLKQGVFIEDLQLIKERTEKIAQMLSEAKAARVTTPSGTNITFSLAGREGLAVSPMGQVIISLPYYAEAAIATVEGTAEGVVVADLTIAGWRYLFQEPLRCTVKAGKVVEIAGSKPDADRLRRVVATDENANNIAELGIGTSHIIPWGITGKRRDFARLGTVHIGIGRNNDIGGQTWSRIHQDALMSRITVELDNSLIFREGALLI